MNGSVGVGVRWKQKEVNERKVKVTARKKM